MASLDKFHFPLKYFYIALEIDAVRFRYSYENRPHTLSRTIALNNNKKTTYTAYGIERSIDIQIAN